jgi:hypothetical protein
MKLKLVYGRYHVYSNPANYRLEVYYERDKWLFDLPYYFPVIHIKDAINIYLEGHLDGFSRHLK